MCTTICDYSLMHAKSRPAVKGEKLITSKLHGMDFGTGGIFSVDDVKRETAVCLIPGTELSFETKAEKVASPWDKIKAMFGIPQNTDRLGTFCQINKDQERVHHDAIKFVDGSIVLVHDLAVGQQLTVLQLPAEPKTEQEKLDQQRIINREGEVVW